MAICVALSLKLDAPNATITYLDLDHLMQRLMNINWAEYIGHEDPYFTIDVVVPNKDHLLERLILRAVSAQEIHLAKVSCTSVEHTRKTYTVDFSNLDSRNKLLTDIKAIHDKRVAQPDLV